MDGFLLECRQLKMSISASRRSKQSMTTVRGRQLLLEGV